MLNLARSAVALVCLAAPPCLAADALVTFSAGVDYSSGDYGQAQDTDIRSLSLMAKYETGRWLYKVSVPYLRVTGPANVVAGEDPIALPGGSAARRTESGLGDVVASAFYNIWTERQVGFLVDVGGKIKFATGDEDKGLGTGETDFALQVDVLKTMERFIPFATFGYRWYGDPPGVRLRNGFYGSLGGMYRVSQQASAGVSYDFRDPIVEGGSKVSELTVFASQRLAREWKAQVYALAGLDDASPDFGIGATLSYEY